MPRRELRATMKLQSETETQRNILKGEMNMLFQTESGQTVGPIGQGTWYLGEDPDRSMPNALLRAGVEAGMNLIDTAEMYGDGAAEELVGRAIQGLDRDKLFLVSKVYPFNAGRGDIRVSCEDSLMRMKTDHLDLYLLHWRGSVPLAETVECMEELKEDGLIRRGACPIWIRTICRSCSPSRTALTVPPIRSFIMSEAGASSMTCCP